MGGLLFQIQRGVQESLHGRAKSLTGRRQADAVLAADQQVQTDLFLQRVHHMGKTRLRITKLCRGGGQTAPLHRKKQRVNFLAVHGG